MIAGVPVVASNLPSTAECVQDEVTGFLCRPGEPHTLAIRIRTAMETPGAADRCAAAARQQAAEWFDADRFLDGYASIYAALSGTLAGTGRSG
jgi:glycosyltransferase involved in cell wall biosynthesis